MTGFVSYHERVDIQQPPRRRLKVRSDSYRNRVLRVVRQAAEPVTMREIAEAASCAVITVRRQLKQLVAEGTVRCRGSRPRISPDGLVLPSKGPNIYST